MALVDEILNGVTLDLPSSSQSDSAVCGDSVVDSVPISSAVYRAAVLDSDANTSPRGGSSLNGESITAASCGDAILDENPITSAVCGDAVLDRDPITPASCDDAILHSESITPAACRDTILDDPATSAACGGAILDSHSITSPVSEDLLSANSEISSLGRDPVTISDQLTSTAEETVLDGDHILASSIDAILDNGQIVQTTTNFGVNNANNTFKRLGYSVFPANKPCSVTDCVQKRFGYMLKRSERHNMGRSIPGVVAQDSTGTFSAGQLKHRQQQSLNREDDYITDDDDVNDELCGFRRELELRRQIAKLRQRCVSEQLTLRTMRHKRDVVLHQLHQPSTAPSRGRQEHYFSQMQVENSGWQEEHMPYMMALRCEDDDAMGVGTAGEEHLSVEPCDAWLYTSNSCAASGVRRVARQLRQYRLQCLLLRCQLLRRSLHETRLRSRLIQCERRRASSEITWRRRLAMLFTDGQMNALRERWRSAGLIDTDSPWEWLPKSGGGSGNAGGTWALQDYRATIELRAHCTARGFNYLLNTLGYPLPSMFATRSAAHCSKYPQVASLYRQLCAHKQVSFERSSGTSLEAEIADEYDAEVAMRFRQLQKEAEMAVLQDEVSRAVDTVEGSALAGVIQWGGAVASATHPPPPSPPPERLMAWLPPSTSSTLDAVSPGHQTDAIVCDQSFCSEDNEEQESHHLQDAAAGGDEHMVDETSAALTAVHHAKTHVTERQSLLHFADSSHQKWI